MGCIAISTYFGDGHYGLTHGLFWLGMAVVGIGFGGFKPTLSPLGADQFNAKHKTEEQKKIAKEARSSFFGLDFTLYLIFHLFSTMNMRCTLRMAVLGQSAGCHRCVFRDRLCLSEYRFLHRMVAGHHRTHFWLTMSSLYSL